MKASIAGTAHITILNWAGALRVKNTVSTAAGIGDTGISLNMKTVIALDAKGVAISLAGWTFGTNAVFALALEGEALTVFQSKAWITEQTQLGAIFDAGRT